MTKQDWKEFILYGLGGLVLFLFTGYFAIKDILSFMETGRPFFVYYSKMSGDNELGIIFTIILGILALIGFFKFSFYVRMLYKKLR